MPSNHVSTYYSFLCSPSNVGGLILFISPFNSSTPDLQCFLVGDGLEILCASLSECFGEWQRCLLPLLDLLFLSGVLRLPVFLVSLSFSNFLSILSRLFNIFKLNSPCWSLTLMRFWLSARRTWASFCNLSMIFIICLSLTISSPCPFPNKWCS